MCGSPAISDPLTDTRIHTFTSRYADVKQSRVLLKCSQPHRQSSSQKREPCGGMLVETCSKRRNERKVAKEKSAGTRDEIVTCGGELSRTKWPFAVNSLADEPGGGALRSCSPSVDGHAH
ncbi:uncharacterized protein LOC122530784 [Frieseomelitta varia]|uniref:uncharacterized protein LOC122530784 n=1 Tax=Frieseomelitta varia TaxID=561572 RepID=UPI001CB69F54|nr:uncharacterized protein LOC122530784 [Frieseomelitta varia]